MRVRPYAVGSLVSLAFAMVCSVAASPSRFTREGIHQRHTSVVVETPEDEFVANVTLAKRAELCAGVDLRAKSRLTGSQVGPTDCSTALATNGIGGSYFFTQGDQAPARITPRTDIARDSKVQLITDRRNFKKTCDHVLEIDILLDVLRDSGACKAAEGMTNIVQWPATDGKKQIMIDVTEGQRKILLIRNVLMRPQNLVSFQARVEHMKTLATQRFKKPGGKNPWDVGSKLDFLAMTDYVLAKTVQKSQATAALLDTEIANQFPGNRGGVAAKWTSYLVYVLAQKRLVTQLAVAELREEQCKQAAGTPLPPSRPGSPTRMVRRATNFSLRPLSSLERRARGAAPRSGKKSPRGPSCPCKQQPPKKKVPKSQAAKRPPPATKPRQPAKRPAPRPPVKKQVAKRPANRPRRAPGKAVTPRRQTPKRKPKPVPKPTRRPKGKARPRRRR